MLNVAKSQNLREVTLATFTLLGSIVHRVYCSSCVRRLASVGSERAVRDCVHWKCYMCDPQQLSGLLTVRHDWRDRVIRLIAPADIPQVGRLCSL